jgi:HSP20 family protein
VLRQTSWFRKGCAGVAAIAFLQQEIDRLFDGFSRSFPSFTTAATVPTMDVAETDKVIEITAELPGLKKKDVELNVTDNLLTIRGEKRSEREEKNKDYHLVERSFGSFARSVELPAGVSRKTSCCDVTAADDTPRRGGGGAYVSPIVTPSFIEFSCLRYPSASPKSANP